MRERGTDRQTDREGGGRERERENQQKHFLLYCTLLKSDTGQVHEDNSFCEERRNSIINPKEQK